MEYGFAILMFALAAFLFIYALIVSTGETGLIMKYKAAKVNDSKKYAKQFSKIMMLVSTSPLLSGIVGMIVKENVLPAFLTLLISLIITIFMGVKYIK